VSGRALTTGAAAALSVALAACGSINASSIEEQIATELERQAKVGAVTVECPEGEEFAAGATFECEATGDVTGTVEVTQTDDQGNVDWELSGRKLTGEG
jgi:uncharacterized protein DUF4333